MASPFQYGNRPLTSDALRAYEAAQFYSFLEGATVANATMMRTIEAFGIRSFVSFNAKQMVNGAYTNTAEQSTEIMGLITKNFAKAISSRKGSFQRMYDEVGKAALSSVADAYNSIDHGPSYREDKRWAGGKLYKAITSPNMYRASYDGIEFINTGWLDGQARQWYRLQFGAGPAQGRNIKPKKAAQGTRLTFFGQDTGITMSLRGLPPSADFYIPPGLFFGANGVEHIGGVGQDQYYPYSEVKTAFKNVQLRRKQGKPIGNVPGVSTVSPIARAGGFTKIVQRNNNLYWRGGLSVHGIAPQRFLDSGVATIARLAPAGNQKLISLMAKEASEFSTGQFAKAALSEKSLAGIQILNQTSNQLTAQSQKFAKERELFLEKIYLSRRGPRLY